MTGTTALISVYCTLRQSSVSPRLQREKYATKPRWPFLDTKTALSMVQTDTDNSAQLAIDSKEKTPCPTGIKGKNINK